MRDNMTLFECITESQTPSRVMNYDSPPAQCNCERSELLICKVHQFGLECIKHCARRQIRIPFRDFFDHFGIVIFGIFFSILYSVIL